MLCCRVYRLDPCWLHFIAWEKYSTFFFFKDTPVNSTQFSFDGDSWVDKVLLSCSYVLEFDENTSSKAPQECVFRWPSTFVFMKQSFSVVHVFLAHYCYRTVPLITCHRTHFTHDVVWSTHEAVLPQTFFSHTRPHAQVWNIYRLYQVMLKGL